MQYSSKKARIEGLEIARFLAFVGMVLVNFSLVIGVEDDSSFIGKLAVLLQGKAAATFVVLAGVGLGLMAQHQGERQTSALIVKRGAFLFIIGILNALIFPADILHFYAVYFFISAWLLNRSNLSLIYIIIGLNIGFCIMVMVLNYDQGWNFDSNEYIDFWTVNGFWRNLWFNGWHPVFPWLGFMLVGILISRFALNKNKVQWSLVCLGSLCILCAEGVRWLLEAPLATIDPELAHLVTTSSIPPMPLYFLIGIGTAFAVIGLCLLSFKSLSRIGVSQFLIPAGQQTLTLYILHIMIGIVLIDELGFTGSQSIPVLIKSTLMFCVFSLLLTGFWNRYFKKGPIEILMRRITG